VVSNGKAVSFLPSDPEGTEEPFTSAEIQAEPNIVLGPEKMFWVASNNKVAKFSPADFEKIVEVPVEGELAPKDIDVAGSLIVISDNDKTPVTELGRVVTFTAAGVQKDFAIPGPSQGLAGAPTGQIAYSAAGAVPEQAGLISPPSPAGAFELIGDPFGVAFGSDQAFWIVEFAKGGLERLTSTGTPTFLPGLPKESARQDAAGPDNTLWVTLVKNEASGVPVSAIARISGLESPVPPTSPTPPPPTNPVVVTTKPVPNTSFGKGPKPVVRVVKGKATVRFSFSSTVAGSSFQCRLFKVPTGKGKSKVPRGAFTSCRSPKVLHVAPGKYRFGVRAVAAGVTDGSAAERAFTVVRIRPHR
jgi:hypothetical protein